MKPSQSAASMITVAALFGPLACSVDTPGNSAEMSISQVRQGLNDLDARIRVKIASTYCNATPLQLCIGSNANCYDLPVACRDGSNCYNSSGMCDVIEREGNGSLASDHPFVDNGDDWDYVYLRSSAGVAWQLSELGLDFDYAGADPAPGLNSPSTYTFVDRQFSPPESFVASQDVPVWRWIGERREDVFKSVYCNGNAGCLGTAFDALPLPLMVRIAAYDIGQAGIHKYRPGGSGNGCDEFFNYHAKLYSNNIHYSCVADDARCTYYKTASNSLGTKQFANAGRLYRVMFSEATIPDPSSPSCGQITYRTGISGIHLCGDEDCTVSNINTSVSYLPKAGDYYYLHRVNSDFHVMMSLGRSPLFIPGAAWDQSELEMAVIDKGTIVHARLDDRRVNGKVGDDCSGYNREFFLGVVDHDVDPPGPVTSGAANPVLGPNAPFVSTLAIGID